MQIIYVVLENILDIVQFLTTLDGVRIMNFVVIA